MIKADSGKSPKYRADDRFSLKRDAPLVGAVGVAYLLAYELAFLFPDSNKVLLAIWPASGIGLGALLLCRKRLWPAIFATLFITGTIANLVHGRPLPVALGYIASNLLESLGCALLMIRLCGREPIRFTRVNEAIALILCAVVVNGCTACIGAATALQVSPTSTFWRLWGTWWICKSLGLLLVTPFVVVWVPWRDVMARILPKRIFEGTLFMVIWFCVAWYAFRPESVKPFFLPRPHLYMLIALLVWPSLRFGRAATTFSLLLLAAIAITGEATQGGLLWLSGESTTGRLLSVQVYLAVVSIVGLLFATSRTEGKEAQRRSEEERARLTALTNNLPDAAVYQIIRRNDGTIRIAYLSEGLEGFTGISATSVLRDASGLYELFSREERKILADIHQASFAAMSAVHEVIRMRHLDGTTRWVNLAATPRLLGDGRVAWDGLMMDVTESKRVARLTTLTNCIEDILNRSHDTSEMGREIIQTLRQHMSIDAVGIRLKDGRDFPYLVQNGFSEEFITRENCLCSRTAEGKPLTDADGKPVLECTCGLVLSGATDPSSPLFTAGGSFWTNAADTLLDLSPQDDPRFNPRNRCIHDGYSSVALVPIRIEEEILGLLQLNDRRKNRFTAEDIRYLEGIGKSIGLAVIQHRSIRSLAESEEKYRALFNTSEVGMFRSKIDGSEIIEANDKFSAIFGCSREEIIGAASPRFWADSGEREEMVRRLRTAGFVNEFECRMKNKGGGIRWCLTSLKHHKESGIIEGSIIDITERKEAEAALAKSEGKYRTIVENLTDQLMVNDFDGKILDVNENTCRTLGYRRSELIGQNLAKITTLRHAALNREKMHLLREQGFMEFETVHLRKDGSLFPCEVSAKVIAQEGRGVMQCFWRDISVRKKVEQTLRESEDKFFKLFHLSPLGMVLARNSDVQGGIIVDVNEKFLGMIEQPREEVLGKKLADLSVWDDEKIWKKASRVLELTGKISQVEIPYRSKSGRKGIFLVSVDNAIINDEHYRIGSAMDITELRRMQELATKTDRLESIGVLAGGIAHDFNNLLGGMYGYIEMAQMQVESMENKKPAEYLGKALGIFERTRDLTRQLLTFAKGGSPVKRAGSLEAVVRGNAEFMLTGTPLTCTFSIPEGLRTCEFDENMIGQVIDNLVINAKQAAVEGGGAIEIGLQNVDLLSGELPPLKKGGYVRISIRDNGRGIPAEILPKIFDPFFTTKQSGSGLGLSTCYSIVKKHNGTITVESAEGKGTTFHLYLPAIAADAVAAAFDLPEKNDAKPGETRVGFGRVLVMDDEEYMRDVVAAMLVASARSVVCARDGQEAIVRIQEARVQEQPFDAIIMDLTIPGGMGGREAIGKLRIIDKTILAIAMSGYSDDPVMADPMRFGFDGCLAKPLRKADLERELGRHRI
jgi:PAS domain S-box-containing protein